MFAAVLYHVLTKLSYPSRCALAGNGERGPEGTNQWERTASIIDFNFTRPTGSGEESEGCFGWLTPLVIACVYALAAQWDGALFNTRALTRTLPLQTCRGSRRCCWRARQRAPCPPPPCERPLLGC